MTSMISAPLTTRAQAAQARAEAFRTATAAGEVRATPPQGVGNSRSLPFAATLRARIVERNGQKMNHLNGVASVTDTPYEMWDFFGPYEEIVAREAFTETLAAQPDVAFLVNHRGVTMARTTAGTLELGMVDAGLGCDAWLNPKRQDVKDLVIAIEDSNIDQMSFAFTLEEGWWSDDFATFKITKVDLDRGDVSAVNYGANPYTSVAARSREILADLDHLPAAAAQAAMNRLAARTDLLITPPVSQSDGAVRGGTDTPAPVTAPAGGSIALYEALLDIE